MDNVEPTETCFTERKLFAPMVLTEMCVNLRSSVLTPKVIGEEYTFR